MSSVADFLRRPLAAALLCGAWTAFYMAPHAGGRPWFVWLVIPIVVCGVALLEWRPQVAALIVLAGCGLGTLAGMPYGEIEMLLPAVSVLASLGLNLDSVVPGLLLTPAFALVLAGRAEAPAYAALLSLLAHAPAWLLGVVVRRRARQAVEAARESASLSAVDLESTMNRSARAGRFQATTAALDVLRGAVGRMHALAEEMARGGVPYRATDAEAIRREGDRAIGRLHDTLTLLDGGAGAAAGRSGRAEQEPDQGDAAERSGLPWRFARWMTDRPSWATTGVNRWFGILLLTAAILTATLTGPHPRLIAAGVAVSLCTFVVHRVPYVASLAAGGAFALAASEATFAADALLPLGVGLGALVWQLTRMPTARGLVPLVIVSAAALLLGVQFGRQGAGFVVVLVLVTHVAATSWKERDDILQREQSRTVRLMAGIAAATARAEKAERMLLARELHDGVSHGITAMSLQVGAAHALGTVDPPRARRSMTAALEVGARTLVEIESLARGRATDDELGVSLDLLVDGARASGLQIRHRAEGEGDRLSYRIVQEALTNITRYAPGARVTIETGESGTRRFVRVVDSGPASSIDGPASGANRVLRSLGQGRGLAGLAERVAERGGRFRAGPRDQGFEIHAEWCRPRSAGDADQGARAQEMGADSDR
ncbi:signal transduction histidine kinase [Microbacterium sp. W4I4]|uniref:sensor histidine kinase n=1 Tax=Microbacterium sp. W4I4 TaxID=3042295 RepID=UPI00278ABE5A|nr:histidine kinase [Microbacterium sp. W4I4]MDQ0613688.1 signal transduction histidine kinase [Microbacterium sp. W4I4]